MADIALCGDRFKQQLQFIIEIDKLKSILRQTLLMDGSRRENSAEHSWHIALMAVLLAEYAPEPVDVLRVMQMLLIHDIVEVDAGDTFCYDAEGHQDKAEREAAAAKRLFGLLPTDQRDTFHRLWHEFEDGETVEAQFAAALDRMQPFLHNQQTQGGTWRLHGIRRSQVIDRMMPIKQGMPDVWSWIETAIDECVEAGYLLP
ncbi:MAG: HD domain-containing protein [Leptolyngbyaceae bacterium]|nr:HD domain-containing protein [Leptolyngbyaceae bacterium]